jgi:hypothetical protein
VQSSPRAETHRDGSFVRWCSTEETMAFAAARIFTQVWAQYERREWARARAAWEGNRRCSV